MDQPVLTQRNFAPANGLALNVLLSRQYTRTLSMVVLTPPGAVHTAPTLTGPGTGTGGSVMVVVVVVVVVVAAVVVVVVLIVVVVVPDGRCATGRDGTLALHAAKRTPQTRASEAEPPRRKPDRPQDRGQSRRSRRIGLGVDAVSTRMMRTPFSSHCRVPEVIRRSTDDNRTAPQLVGARAPRRQCPLRRSSKPGRPRSAPGRSCPIYGRIFAISQ